MRFTVRVHHEGAEYWSEIAELPGCFASGRTLSELHEALGEAIGLYLWNEPVTVTTADLAVGAGQIEVSHPAGPGIASSA